MYLYKLHFKEIPFIVGPQVHSYIVTNLQSRVRLNISGIFFFFQFIDKRFQYLVLLHDDQRIGGKLPIFVLQFHFETIILQHLILQPSHQFFIFQLFQLFLYLLLPTLFPKYITNQCGNTKYECTNDKNQNEPEPASFFRLLQFEFLFLYGRPTFHTSNLSQTVYLIQRIFILFIPVQINISTVLLLYGSKTFRHILYDRDDEVDIPNIHSTACLSIIIQSTIRSMIILVKTPHKTLRLNQQSFIRKFGRQSIRF